MTENQEPEIFSYLPHRPPMLFIDRLIKVVPEKMEAEYEITSNCIFLRKDNSLEEVAYIEILAQCFAAGNEFLNQGKKIEFGYLAAMRNMKIHGKAYLGDTIRAVTSLIVNLDGIIVFEGELFCKEKMILSGQLKVYIPNVAKSEK